MTENPVRRIRVKHFHDHNPPVWASYYEPPGRAACYCWAPTLEEMWRSLEDYFNGKGEVPPQRVEDRLMRFLEPGDACGPRRRNG